MTKFSLAIQNAQYVVFMIRKALFSQSRDMIADFYHIVILLVLNR